METPEKNLETSTIMPKNKLLPFIIIAEIGFAAWSIGYCFTFGAIFVICATPSLAAIIFTIL